MIRCMINTESLESTNAINTNFYLLQCFVVGTRLIANSWSRVTNRICNYIGTTILVIKINKNVFYGIEKS